MALTGGTDLTKHVELLRTRRPEYSRLIDLYVFFHEAAADEAARVNLPPFDLSQGPSVLGGGFHLFAAGTLPIDAASVRRMVEVFMQADVPDRAGLEKAAAFLDRSPDYYNQVPDLLLRLGDGASEEAAGAEVDAQLLSFLLHMALKPSLTALRRTVAGLLGGAGWQEGFCPVCGSAPGMARLEKDGHRALACSLCGQEWHFPRMACPFCRTEDQKSLYYLYADEEEGYRVYACKECGGYIKTVDARVLEDPAPLDLEDLTTLHLDMIAEKKGLVREGVGA